MELGAGQTAGVTLQNKSTFCFSRQYRANVLLIALLTLCISEYIGLVPLPTFSLYKTYVSPVDPKRKKRTVTKD